MSLRWSSSAGAGPQGHRVDASGGPDPSRRASTSLPGRRGDSVGAVCWHWLGAVDADDQSGRELIGGFLEETVGARDGCGADVAGAAVAVWAGRDTAGAAGPSPYPRHLAARAALDVLRVWPGVGKAYVEALLPWRVSRSRYHHIDPAVVRGERITEHGTTQVARSEADSRATPDLSCGSVRSPAEHRVFTLRCVPCDTPGRSRFVRGECCCPVVCPKNNTPVRAHTAGSGDAACHAGRVGGVIEIRDILSCECASRQGLLNNVCGQQNSRCDLIADLLIMPIGVLDVEVVEMVVVLDEMMP